MSNRKVLKFLEQNMEGLEKIEYFMMHEDSLTYGDLMWELQIDHFEGYECLLPVMLLASKDPALQRAVKRLLLQLYREKIEQTGASETVDYVIQLLKEEYKSWETRQKKVDELEVK